MSDLQEPQIPESEAAQGAAAADAVLQGAQILARLLPRFEFVLSTDKNFLRLVFRRHNFDLSALLSELINLVQDGRLVRLQSSAIRIQVRSHDFIKPPFPLRH